MGLQAQTWSRGSARLPLFGTAERFRLVAWEHAHTTDIGSDTPGLHLRCAKIGLITWNRRQFRYHRDQLWNRCILQRPLIAPHKGK